MGSRERVLSALNHQHSDLVPVDFGSTAVTGIHVYAVAALRDYYGLEKRPVKVHEPYQMLGLIEDDLIQAMGIDVEGIPAPETLFGFRNEDWKSCLTENGLEVLVSKHFNTTRDVEGNIYIYPKGDLSAPASGKMPKNGFFFDTIISSHEVLLSDFLSLYRSTEKFCEASSGGTSPESKIRQKITILCVLRALERKRARGIKSIAYPLSKAWAFSGAEGFMS